MSMYSSLSKFGLSVPDAVKIKSIGVGNLAFN